jgi:hypothetical protein
MRAPPRLLSMRTLFVSMRGRVSPWMRTGADTGRLIIQGRGDPRFSFYAPDDPTARVAPKLRGTKVEATLLEDLISS